MPLPPILSCNNLTLQVVTKYDCPVTIQPINQFQSISTQLFLILSFVVTDIDTSISIAFTTIMILTAKHQSIALLFR